MLRWLMLLALLGAIFGAPTTLTPGGAGIDISNPLPVSAWQCLAKSSLKWAVVRSWHSYGAFDTNAPSSLAAASAAGARP